MYIIIWMQNAYILCTCFHRTIKFLFLPIVVAMCCTFIKFTYVPALQPGHKY